MLLVLVGSSSLPTSNLADARSRSFLFGRLPPDSSEARTESDQASTNQANAQVLLKIQLKTTEHKGAHDGYNKTNSGEENFAPVKFHLTHSSRVGVFALANLLDVVVVDNSDHRGCQRADDSESENQSLALFDIDWNFLFPDLLATQNDQTEPD